MNWITGFHAIEEALAAGRPLDRILIAKGGTASAWKKSCGWRNRAAFRCASKIASRSIALTGTREHQGIAAVGAAKPAVGLEDLLAAKERAGLLVLLDGVEDPHNLGAIVRTSLAAGAQGVVIPERRAAGLTDTVERASAGALGASARRAREESGARDGRDEGSGLLARGARRARGKTHTEVDLKGSGRNRAGPRGRRAARTDAQALRFSGFDSHARAGAVAKCFGRRRRDAFRSSPPAARRLTIRHSRSLSRGRMYPPSGFSRSSALPRTV